MERVVCLQPGELKMVQADCPVLASGDALVHIRRIGICGTDFNAFAGQQPYFTYPRILGHELSGEIVEIDENSSGLQTGDRVTILPYLECGECIACRNGKPNCCTRLSVLGVHKDGGMQEWLAVPASHLIKTNEITLDEACVIEPLSIGAHAIRRATIKPGETVLVIGTGPIGLGVMKFAKLAGARVLAMDINESRLTFARHWIGTDGSINATKHPVESLETMTNGDNPTIVFDATGNVHSMIDSFEYVAHGGKLVFVGLVKNDVKFNDPDFHKKELTLLSSRNATREDFSTVIQAFKDGEIDINSYVTHRENFNHTVEAFTNWRKPEAGVIKAMLELPEIS